MTDLIPVQVVGGRGPIPVRISDQRNPPEVEWFRPLDWLPIPQLVDSDQRFVGLFAVQPTGSNLIALSAAGAYTVNWGNGVVQSFAANAVAQYSYAFSDTGLPSAVDTDGCKQAIISLTMQTGQTFTRFDLQILHSSVTTVKAESRLREVAVAGSALTTINIGSMDDYTTEPFVTYPLLAIGALYGTTALEVVSQFSRCTALRYVPNFCVRSAPVVSDACTFTTGTNIVTDAAHGRTNGAPVYVSAVSGPTTIAAGYYYFATNVTTDTYQLSAVRNSGVVIAFDLSGTGSVAYGAICAYTFNLTERLYRLPVFSMVGVVCFSGYALLSGIREATVKNTYNCRDFGNMFNTCRWLKQVVGLDTTAGVYFAFMFNACYSLETPPVLNTTSALTLQALFFNCNRLQTQPVLTFTGTPTTAGIRTALEFIEAYTVENTSSLTDMSSWFRQWRSLRSLPTPPNTTSNADFSTFFDSCSSLIALPTLNTAAGTSCNQMYNLIALPVPVTTWTALRNAFGMFRTYAGTAIPLLDSSLWTNIVSFLLNAYAVTTLPAYNFSSVTTATNFVNGAVSLTNALHTGLQYSHSYATTAIGKTNLEAIFGRLPKAFNTSQVIAITGIPGAIGAQAPITKTSCVTTLGSAVVSCSDTSSLATGMIVTGTGISPAVAVTFTASGSLVTNGTRPAPPNGTVVSMATVVTTTGIVTYTRYFVINRSGSTFQLSLTSGGAAITLTNNGSGTMIYGSYIQSINPGVSFTLDMEASATGTNTMTARALDTFAATSKGWSVTG